jgi:hypothetical protein
MRAFDAAELGHDAPGRLVSGAVRGPLCPRHGCRGTLTSDAQKATVTESLRNEDRPWLARITQC